MDKYYTYENGIRREMTEAEVEQVVSENQRQHLEDIQTDTVTTADIINAILEEYTVTLPDGQVKPVTQVTDSPINLPLKLGQKWVMVKSGNGFVYQLVTDPDAVGTSEDSPIIYYAGCPLMNNAFYKKDGKIQVYMNGQWAEW